MRCGAVCLKGCAPHHADGRIDLHIVDDKRTRLIPPGFGNTNGLCCGSGWTYFGLHATQRNAEHCLPSREADDLGRFKILATCMVSLRLAGLQFLTRCRLRKGTNAMPAQAPAAQLMCEQRLTSRTAAQLSCCRTTVQQHRAALRRSQARPIVLLLWLRSSLPDESTARRCRGSPQSAQPCATPSSRRHTRRPGPHPWPRRSS